MIAGNQLQMTGACPGGPVLIGLTPGNEQLAHQLLADYGRKIAITVGLTTYDGSPGRRFGRQPLRGRAAANASFVQSHQTAVPLGSGF